jgi:hypothetical protein
MANAQQAKDAVIRKLARNGYSSSGQLNNDLSRAGFSSSEANSLANQFIEGQKASTSNSNRAIQGLNNLGSGVKSTLKSGGDILFAPMYDQNNWDRPIVKAGMLQQVFNTVIDNGLNIFDQLAAGLSGAASLFASVVSDAYTREGELLKAFTAKAGMAGQFASGFTESIMAVAPQAQLLGVSFGDLKDATESMVSNSQKFANYQGESVLDAIRISAAYGSTSKALLENVENFRDVGIGLTDASGKIEQIGKRSLSQGLSARATTKTVMDNLGKLNEFGFKNGVEGLGKMVQEAQALNFKMEETFKVAAKLYDPEGAIDLSANLQVIGGAIGDLADPIKLMYDATNNVESLQTSILGAAKTLATYNAEQGRFEVTGANLRRAKAMSDALGISMEQLTSSAIKGQVQMQAMSQIELFDLNEDQKQFVSNLATMKDGVVGFELPKDLQKELGINQAFLDMSSLNGEQMAKIAEAQKRLSERKTDDIIRDQYTVQTQSLNALNSIAMNIGNMARTRINQNEIVQKIKESAGGLDEIAKMTPEEIEAKYNDAVQKYINGPLDALKGLSETALEKAGSGFDSIKNKANEILDESGGSDLLKKVEDKGKQLYEEAKKIFGSVEIKVDLNSSSSELASMVVNEINKDPGLRASFVSSLVKDSKSFT